MKGGSPRSSCYTTRDYKLSFGGTLKLKEVISVYTSQDDDALHEEIMIKSGPEFNMSRQSFFGRIVSEEEEYARKWKECEGKEVGK